MAVCGLDCGSCEIRLAPENPEAARIVVAWFQEMGWLDESEGIAEVIEREMYCTGCRGDRSVHWSPDCPLLTCCVDEKHLEHCAQCDEFVCEKLEAFATDGQTRHREAVERLRKIAESRQ
jgi:hypothetical protein